MMVIPAIQIAVATHKPYRMPDDSAYLPLHVGAVLHPEICQDMQGDDDGDSISWKNPRYCELTGLYWMWKNSNANYKGLVHYRRYLGSPNIIRRHSKDRFERFATGEELLSILNQSSVVVAKRRRYYIETVYNHYSHTFDHKHFDECRTILEKRCPECLEAWDELMSSRGAHIYNMFVMRRDMFDSYCEWLFPIIEELDQRIDNTGYSDFESRYLGRVSERLLDPWLKINSPTYKELAVVSPEPIDWISKGKGFLAAKFFGKKYTTSF